MKKKVAQVFRVSTPGQAGDDRASFASQQTAASRISQVNDLEITHTIKYSDVSGAAVLLTPEIQGLVRLMLSGEIQGVIAREFSRLMRPESFGDYALLQAFVDSKAVLYLPDGPIDFSNKVGQFFGTVRAAMAGLERNEILERVFGAKEEKRKRGELAQSSIVLPYGTGYDEIQGFFYKPEAQLVHEAIRRFLSGNESYAQLAPLLGVTPRGVHTIFRNPIWIGLRVIDKRRDTSAAGKYQGVNGRQTDRRKIARAKEDVICIQVIEKPLLTADEFVTLQFAMDVRQKKHWRSDGSYEHRFIYNGFLTCSECNKPIQTALARRDYYACKGRRTCHDCKTRYMGREALEAVLDDMFTNQLSSRSFLEHCVKEMQARADKADSGGEVERLTLEVSSLRRQRGRVIDLFVKGLIEESDRDKRLSKIDGGIRAAEAILGRSVVDRSLDLGKLIELFSPLAEWEFWSRDQKRQLLTTLVPDIRVANLKVESLGLNPRFFSHEVSRTGMDSWPPPA